MKIDLDGDCYISTTEVSRAMGLMVPSDRLVGLGFRPHYTGQAVLWRQSDLGPMMVALANDLRKRAGKEPVAP